MAVTGRVARSPDGPSPQHGVAHAPAAAAALRPALLAQAPPPQLSKKPVAGLASGARVKGAPPPPRGALQPGGCRIGGCSHVLATGYNARSRLCDAHLRAPVLRLPGVAGEARFCQKCCKCAWPPPRGSASPFLRSFFVPPDWQTGHALSDFDGDNRACRVRCGYAGRRRQQNSSVELRATYRSLPVAHTRLSDWSVRHASPRSFAFQVKLQTYNLQRRAKKERLRAAAGGGGGASAALQPSTSSGSAGDGPASSSAPSAAVAQPAVSSQVTSCAAAAPPPADLSFALLRRALVPPSAASALLSRLQLRAPSSPRGALAPSPPSPLSASSSGNGGGLRAAAGAAATCWSPDTPLPEPWIGACFADAAANAPPPPPRHHTPPPPGALLPSCWLSLLSPPPPTSLRFAGLKFSSAAPTDFFGLGMRPALGAAGFIDASPSGGGDSSAVIPGCTLLLVDAPPAWPAIDGPPTRAVGSAATSVGNLDNEEALGGPKALQGLVALLSDPTAAGDLCRAQRRLAVVDSRGGWAAAAHGRVVSSSDATNDGAHPAPAPPPPRCGPLSVLALLIREPSAASAQPQQRVSLALRPPTTAHGAAAAAGDCDAPALALRCRLTTGQWVPLSLCADDASSFAFPDLGRLLPPSLPGCAALFDTALSSAGGAHDARSLPRPAPPHPVLLTRDASVASELNAAAAELALLPVDHPRRAQAEAAAHALGAAASATHPSPALLRNAAARALRLGWTAAAAAPLDALAAAGLRGESADGGAPTMMHLAAAAGWDGAVRAVADASLRAAAARTAAAAAGASAPIAGDIGVGAATDRDGSAFFPLGSPSGAASPALHGSSPLHLAACHADGRVAAALEAASASMRDGAAPRAWFTLRDASGATPSQIAAAQRSPGLDEVMRAFAARRDSASAAAASAASDASDAGWFVPHLAMHRAAAVLRARLAASPPALADALDALTDAIGAQSAELDGDADADDGDATAASTGLSGLWVRLGYTPFYDEFASSAALATRPAVSADSALGAAASVAALLLPTAQPPPAGIHTLLWRLSALAWLLSSIAAGGAITLADPPPPLTIQPSPVARLRSSLRPAAAKLLSRCERFLTTLLWCSSHGALTCAWAASRLVCGGCCPPPAAGAARTWRDGVAGTSAALAAASLVASTSPELRGSRLCALLALRGALVFACCAVGDAHVSHQPLRPLLLVVFLPTAAASALGGAFALSAERAAFWAWSGAGAGASGVGGDAGGSPLPAASAPAPSNAAAFAAVVAELRLSATEAAGELLRRASAFVSRSSARRLRRTAAASPPVALTSAALAAARHDAHLARRYALITLPIAVAYFFKWWSNLSSSTSGDHPPPSAALSHAQMVNLYAGEPVWLWVALTSALFACSSALPPAFPRPLRSSILFAGGFLRFVYAIAWSKRRIAARGGSSAASSSSAAAAAAAAAGSSLPFSGCLLLSFNLLLLMLMPLPPRAKAALLAIRVAMPLLPSRWDVWPQYAGAAAVINLALPLAGLAWVASCERVGASRARRAAAKLHDE